MTSSLVNHFAAYLAESYGCPRIADCIDGPAGLSSVDVDVPVAVLAAPSGLDRSEYRHAIESAGLEIMFQGLAGDDDGQRRTIVSVVRRPRQYVTPAEFRVVALVGAYNEEDVIQSFLEHTIGQGVEVYLLDNWSTDRTVERAQRFLGRGLIGIEKFPETGPTHAYEWHSMLCRKEELAGRMEADWFIHIDPDEIRESPWPDVTLRDAFYRVQTEDFNAVNHTCIVFHPTGRGYDDQLPIQPQFSHFEFGSRPGQFAQVKAWARQTERIQLADSGGHDARFPGRRVYPFRFLLKHYPIRSQQHGEKKVFAERLGRFSQADRERGWHTHYDEISENHSFVRDASALLRFSPEEFHENYLVERLTGLRPRQQQQPDVPSPGNPSGTRAGSAPVNIPPWR